MLILLSPAKSLDYDTPVPAGLAHTLPHFIPQSSQLIALLRQQSPQEVASLMKISDALAALNVARYASWTPQFSADNARQAVLAFNGDVYEGLDAHTLSHAELDWAQAHLAILSGLYGVLRPLDWMQPYRLEMGTRLRTSAGNTLYQFWGAHIAQCLNQQLAATSSNAPGMPAKAPTTAPVVLNLASQEYFKAVDRKALQARVVECVFEEWKGSRYQIVSFHAKRARGLMARYAIRQHCTRPEQLQHFDAEGYAFDSAASTPDRLVFRRRRD